MSIEDDVEELMALVREYGEMREWHGARPGDDETGQLEAADAKVMAAFRNRLTLEIGALDTAIEQVAAGDAAGAVKMLRRRMEYIVGPNA